MNSIEKNKNDSPQQQPQQQQTTVELNEKDQMVCMIYAPNSEIMKFPGVWLRDNCRCELCFHQTAKSRMPQIWNNFDTKIKIKELNFDAKEKRLQIVWSDLHQSAYELNWLKSHDFSENKRTKYLSDWYRPEQEYWCKKDFERILKKFDYVEIMQNDAVLAQWLQSLAVHGVAMLKNAPLDLDVVQKLCARIGFIRKTSYGEEFHVKSRPGALNYAYLAAPLPLHTDMPYFEYVPSVTILHTIEQSQSSGGWNLLSDAYYIADHMRQHYPAEFKLLTETHVDWADIGMENGEAFHNIWRAPVINLDAEGKYMRINHSIPQRDSHFSVPLERVVPWYEANALFIRLVNEQAVHFKMQPGDVLSFNNLRLVHGRTGYDDTEANVRHVIGGFVDWDIVYSKMRVLKSDTQFKSVQKDY